METTFLDEQVLAVADSLKGEETVAPVEGLLTVTPANAGKDTAKTVEQVRANFLKRCMKFPFTIEELFALTPFDLSPRTEHVCLSANSRQGGATRSKSNAQQRRCGFIQTMVLPRR